MKSRALGLCLVLAALAGSCNQAPGAAPTEQAKPGAKVLYYRSPMDPSFISKNPGKDAMGMKLVPVHEGDPGANLDLISLNGAVIQRMGVRVAEVKQVALTRVVRALGRVEFDESRVTTVNMKFDGWIEKLWVDETGQFVRKGAPLFAIYSPELLASEEEYLQILQATAAGPHSEHLLRAARQRLLQFDVPASLVERITRTRKAERRVVVTSPARGYVIHKTAFEGTFVKKGANLFTLGDLGALWVVADVFELDAPWVMAGQRATVELEYLPGQPQEATVDYVYPTLDQKTRALQVRLVLPNPDVALKPGMFATVRIHTQPVGVTLAVPSEAVIHSGERSIVFVSKGEGRFEPRELELGVLGDDMYQVRSGLQEGEQVVVSGEFLLDSESRLKEAVKKMLGGNLATGAAMPAAAQGKGDAGVQMPSMPGMAMPPSKPPPATKPAPERKVRQMPSMPGMQMPPAQPVKRPKPAASGAPPAPKPVPEEKARPMPSMPGMQMPPAQQGKSPKPAASGATPATSKHSDEDHARPPD